jgi:HTH-type transcriptional regulator/antitoxin HipB
MQHPTNQMGEIAKKVRKSLGLTQRDVALTSGTGLRFIIDFEKGKQTCQLGKAITVLQTLGIKINFLAPGSKEHSLSGSRSGSKFCSVSQSRSNTNINNQ